MSDLIRFDFNGHGVRVIRTDDREEWIAKDACEALEIEKYRDALSRLDDDERGSVVVDTLGGPQEMATVTESGLYSLILRSRKPAAKAFKRWVTHEVIPSIRRNGGYVAPGHEAQFLELLTSLTTEVKALREWKDSTERAHPFGLMGTRDAKVLSGQMREIRDLMIEAGSSDKPRALLLIIDRSIRLQAGYPKDKGAKWECATATQATIAFSRATQWIASLRKDIDRRRAAAQAHPNQGALFPFDLARIRPSTQ
jgi:prophage antirepressor-like protein